MKKYLSVVLAIGLVLALSGCDELGEWLISAAFEPYAYVVDEEEKGIVGANVTLTDAADGRSVFTGATTSKGYIGFGTNETWDGDYTLTVEMEGYETVSITVTIAKTAQFLGKIVLSESAFEPYIHVVDNNGNLEGATVTLTD